MSTSARLELVVATIAAAVFAAGFGLNYGVDNQTVYFLGALRMVHPQLFAHDWLVTQATLYHVGFQPIAALLIALNEHGWAIGIAHMAALTGGMLCMYAMLRAIVGRPAALPAFFLLLALACVTRTASAGVTYVFDWIFQPTTLASVGLLAALPFFAQGRWLASGVCIALCGLFHANYLVLVLMTFGLAQLLLGRRDLLLRLVLQLGPACIVLCGFLPMILRTAVSPHAEQAQTLYFNMRSPHHYVPANFERDFTPFVAWYLMAAGASFQLLRREVRVQRIAAVIAGLSFIVWAGLAMSTYVHVRTATALMTWRLNPHCLLMLQALWGAGMTSLLLDPTAARRLRPSDLAMFFAGLGLLVMNGGDRNDRGVSQIVLAVTAAVIVFKLVQVALDAVTKEPTRDRLAASWRGAAPLIVTACALPVLASAASGPLSSVREHRMTILNGHGRGDEELYAWMRDKSPVDAMFLTPPRVDTMRYLGQRAIVVDWKSAPIVPDEVLEWYRRLQDVCGREKFTSHNDLEGYRSMDPARLESLKKRYDIDFVVLYRGQEGAFRGYKTAFSNGAYVVLDLRKNKDA